MSHIRLENRIRADAEACFTLSLTVDAHTASMGRSAERAIAGVTSGVLGPGDTVTWQARHFGLPFRMTVAVTDYDPPRRFVDEQIGGPFAAWRHEHVFQALPDGRTLMIDEINFASPLGLLGRAVDRLVLTHYLRDLVQRRNDWLQPELERTD